MLHWYVIHSKPQKEFLLREQLCLREFEAYCPTVQVQRVNPRARKMRPYFPGYLFTHVDLDVINASILRWLPGAIGLVNFGGEPACMPDNILKVIQSRVNEINAQSKKPLVQTLKTGDAVTIHSGPFAGHEAIFCTELRESERVQVLLRLLQDYSVRVDLPASQIEPTKQNHR